jgi:hypothetical protein
VTKSTVVTITATNTAGQKIAANITVTP